MTLPFMYLGREKLKEVNVDGAGYPVFWIDVSDTTHMTKHEKNLLVRSHIEPKDVIEFCESLFDSPEPKVGQPFILGDPDKIFPFPRANSKDAAAYRDAYKASLTAGPAISGDLPRATNGANGEAATRKAKSFTTAVDNAVQGRDSKH